MAFFGWGAYVSVAERRAKAQKEMEKLRKKGKRIEPVELEGRTIAASFWGKAWCEHLESFSDYENRLPRGRTYVRNGSVCHLEIQPGLIDAFVSGSSLYKVSIKIKPLAAAKWKAVKAKCRGQIGSILELLQGKISAQVMGVVSDQTEGLFPLPGEMQLVCNCPDWAVMCKHVAAVLYGVGNRLDHQPELLFALRGVDAAELVSSGVMLPAAAGKAAKGSLAEDKLAQIFDIDIDAGDAPAASPVGDAAEQKRKKAGGRVSNKKAGAAGSASGKNPKKKKSATAVAAKESRRKNPVPVFDPKAPTGAAIAALRAKCNQSPAEFAEELGVTVASVLRWESTRGALRLYTRPLAALTRMQENLTRLKR